jgi:hypothetical protein
VNHCRHGRWTVPEPVDIPNRRDERTRSRPDNEQSFDLGPILRDAHSVRIDRHAATRRLKLLATVRGSGSPGCTRTCCATRS